MSHGLVITDALDMRPHCAPPRAFLLAVSNEDDELLAPDAAKVVHSRSGHDSVVHLQSQMGTMSNADNRTLMQKMFSFLYTEHSIMRSNFIEEMRYL